MFIEIEDPLDSDLVFPSIHLSYCGALRTELGILDADDGDAVIHEQSFRSRYQSGKNIKLTS